MSVVARKLETLQRVVRTRGLRGVSSAIADNAEPLYHEARRARAVVAARLRYGPPRLLLTFRGGIGDDLTCTVLLRELRRRNYGPVWMLSRYPDLYEHNPDPAAVLPWGTVYEPWIKRFNWPLLNPRYFHFDRETDRAVLVSPGRHMITMMCQLVGIVGPIVRRPYFTLLDQERAAGSLVPNQVVVQSSGMVAGTPMLNKQWLAERFQEVVLALRSEFNLVQLGAPSDPPLEGVLDLRGKTTRRQTAAIVSQSITCVTNIGFLMHLARAVECRSVIVYGGREHPDQSGYSCNENLFGDVPCAPCWQRNLCAYDRRCMRQISAADVVAAVRRVAEKHGTPLEVDTDVVPAERLEPPGPDGRRMLTITTPAGVTRRIEAKLLTGAAG